jgi:hypothetical protein
LSASLGQGRSCGHEIAGLLEDELRDWGARRVPVRMGRWIDLLDIVTFK